MRKLSAIIFLFGFITSAYADDILLNSSKNNIPTYLNNSFSVYIANQSINYNEYEYLDKEVLDSEKGSLPGIILEFNKSMGSFVLTLDANYYQGGLTYYGSTWGGTPLSFVGQHTIYNYSWQLAYPIYLPDNVVLTPIEKIGYRNWDRATDASSRPGDYEESYMNYYAQLGADLGVVINKDFYFDGTLLLGSTFNAQMAPHAMPVGTQAPIFTLGSAAYITAKLQGNYLLARDLLLRAFVQYNTFSFGESNSYFLGNSAKGVPQYVNEPHSITNDATFGLGIAYSFAGV